MTHELGGRPAQLTGTLTIRHPDGRLKFQGQITMTQTEPRHYRIAKQVTNARLMKANHLDELTIYLRNLAAECAAMGTPLNDEDMTRHAEQWADRKSPEV